MFPKIGIPQNGWFMWKTLLKWMIWGYHYFWKHPFISCHKHRSRELPANRHPLGRQIHRSPENVTTTNDVTVFKTDPGDMPSPFKSVMANQSFQRKIGFSRELNKSGVYKYTPGKTNKSNRNPLIFESM